MAETKLIFEVPAVRWDRAMGRDKPAQAYGPSDLANLTGGIVFGLSAGQVGTRLPNLPPDMDWAGLPLANEYPNDIRYFWTRLDDTTELRDGVRGCAGTNSYVVFLFSDRGLFRISWRLIPDETCPSTREAAESLYARYLAIDRAAAIAAHYRAGSAEAVEVTDPSAGYLMPYRWDKRQRR